MYPEQIPGENDQADMKGTSMDDLPGTDSTDEDADVDVDAEQENQDADQLEDAEQKAAEKRELEGGLR
ncbi:hypothetical protein [Sphingobium yanoikuyae]|uniref:Uncharacterized protein n=1 Tax=Sphingobium yanoikuyae TaxID=13690 RepID=A0A430BQ70_SPHYA|nr:hypothetical protein [Sphingobium yanoikuyae]RSU54874.1 hypothetical protein DAH51_18850 [Sphingobium yanoikuyae]